MTGNENTEPNIPPRQLVIIHGTGGSPDENWFPWLASKASAAGCEVIVPQFPMPQTPASWLTRLDEEAGALGPRTTLVGHSLGCAMMLRVLERAGEPIEASVFVSGFLGELGNAFDPLNEAFFATPFDWETIRRRAGVVEALDGEYDPYVSAEKGQELATLLQRKLRIIPHGGHLNEEAGFAEFPLLWEKLQDIWDI